MMRNYHVRFGSGGGGSNPFANYNHQNLSTMRDEMTGKRRVGQVRIPAMAAGLTDHVWNVWELLCYKVAPLPGCAQGTLAPLHTSPS